MPSIISGYIIWKKQYVFNDYAKPRDLAMSTDPLTFPLSSAFYVTTMYTFKIQSLQMSSQKLITWLEPPDKANTENVGEIFSTRSSDILPLSISAHHRLYWKYKQKTKNREKCKFYY